MKFYIDDNEIKTVNKNATIEGSLNLVSRIASFAYICLKDTDFKEYKAKLGSKVLIKNDKNKSIFKGNITLLSYDFSTGIIKVQARDLTSILLNTKAVGRYKGTLLTILKKAIGKFNIALALATFLSKEVNILSFGKFSLYDILSVAISKIYGNNFKFYIDASSKLNIIIPSLSKPKGDFITGVNVINAVYFSENNSNKARIKAIGNNEIVAGVLINLIDSATGMQSCFIVEKDKHIYTDVHTMELELKERK